MNFISKSNSNNTPGGKRIMNDMIVRTVRKNTAEELKGGRAAGILKNGFSHGAGSARKTLAEDTNQKNISKKFSLFSSHTKETSSDSRMNDQILIQDYKDVQLSDRGRKEIFERGIPVKKERTSSDIILASRESLSHIDEKKFSSFSVSDKDKKGRFSFSVRPRWYLKKPFLISYGVFAFAGFLIGLDMFSRVTVEITPRQEMFNIDAAISLTASQSSEVTLETMHVEQKQSASRPVSGKKQIEEYASGTVVIYNAFSSEAQLLVRRTRFSTPDGKIYRLAEAVTVPGAQIIDGKIKPSSIEATLLADQPGEDYNIGLTDFMIPGFKGTPRYEKFYARSKTPMTGGFKGISKVVSEEDIRVLSETIESQLSDDLASRAIRELPDHLFIPKGASRTILKEKVFSAEAGRRAETVTLEAIFAFDGLAVPKEGLKKALIRRFVDKNNEYPHGIDIINMDALSYRAENVDFEKGRMTLNISGGLHAAWKVDKEDLSANLASAGFRKHMQVFEQYPFVERAIIYFSPSWWRIFPDDAKKIEIKEKF